MSAKTTRAAVICGAAVLALALSAQDAALRYQSRGNRSEGLRGISVGGLDVELLSASVESSNERRASGWADSVHLRFYLPDDDKVFITVRQLRSRDTYYWLNNVTSKFKTRAVNEYDWPTGPVLRKLRDVHLGDLGATVRLGREQPSKNERVLPAILFDAAASGIVEAYRFVLKTNGKAKVAAAVYSGEKPLFKRTADWERPNSPFTIRWDAGTSAEGWYRLVLSGYFANNTPLDKEVRFYHRTSLKR